MREESSNDSREASGLSYLVTQSGRGLAAIFSVLVMAVIAFLTLDEVTARFGVIALSLAIVVLSQPLGATRLKALGWLIDVVIIGLFVFAGYLFFQVKEEFFTGFYIATPINIAAGILGMIALILLSTRIWGWSLTIMVAVITVFGFAGPHLPGLFQHFGMGLEEFMQITWYSFDGTFGRITGLVAENVLIFLIFGAVLEVTGAGLALIKIATALTGRIRGGAAHSAIVASTIFGMMSGSVAANIAGTGVFTIPMIKKQGFSPNFAAAVETAASSGGQLTPPIMAAAVFVMADLVQMPFALVILAATLPAIFKYVGLFAQVYAEAIRQDIKPLAKEDIPQLTRKDWLDGAMVFVPIGMLVVGFLSGKSPATAGLWGVITALVMGLLINPEFRKKPQLILHALIEGGISAAKIMISVGVLGIALAVLNETGIAISIGASIAQFGEGNLLIALMLAMLGALVLGMGLPTLPAYLIIAVMIVPAIISSGVLPLAAHMFVLYFAVYSSIVPPMAYGCYVAAPIAGGKPLPTSFIALRISAVGLLVPYVFVFSPSLLLVAGEFDWVDFTGTVIRLLAVVWMFASSFGGADPRLGKLPLNHRALRAAVGTCALIPVPLIWIPAVVATVVIGLFSPKPSTSLAS